MDGEDIMTLEEVAKYLKLKPQTVYKWAQEEKIPAAKLGKEWRFRKSILDEWIDSSIILSKAGFDLLLQSSLVATTNKGMSGPELDELLKKVMS